MAITSKFEIYALAGKGDFNNDEVLSLDTKLGGTSWVYTIATFDGGHNRPSSSYLEDAFLWFELNAMRDGVIPVDKQLVNDKYNSSVIKYKALLEKKQYIAAETECRKGIVFYNQLHNTRRLEKEVENIQKFGRIPY